MKTKQFDCVEMKRKGAEAVRKNIQGKTIEQQLEYWRKGTEQLRSLKDKLKANHNRNQNSKH